MGIFRPSTSPSSASSSPQDSTSSTAVSSSAGEREHTAARQSTHSSAGISVSSSCTASLARSTCHGRIGSDCTSHRLFPSSDTEGAAMSFIPAIMHTAAHSSSGTVLARSPKTAFSV